MWKTQGFNLHLVGLPNGILTATATPIPKIGALLEPCDRRAANPSAGKLVVVPKFEVGAW